MIETAAQALLREKRLLLIGPGRGRAVQPGSWRRVQLRAKVQNHSHGALKSKPRGWPLPELETQH